MYIHIYVYSRCCSSLKQLKEVDCTGICPRSLHPHSSWHVRRRKDYQCEVRACVCEWFLAFMVVGTRVLGLASCSVPRKSPDKVVMGWPAHG